ncbi:sperm flagellar protein 2 isoform X3 [Brachyhypopomus gauderio]|uniref:sperm flagellar protein 2 isoform X3 n=1 Tax=Brachyhypopomus gauderio TaxID=698409 RepID=UPI0040425662
MSDILCRWLNSELRLSKVVEPHSFPKDFANGYLIGEVLNKYQLQDDFDHFSKHSAANAKLNNFTRLEPTLQLLGVPFDLGMAKAVMQGQQGAAMHLLYQLYILLQKKKRAGLTGATLETMQPAATARLHQIENRIYTERLRLMTKREADLKMQKITQRFDKRRQDTHDRYVMSELEREQKRRHLQEEMRLQDIEKHRQARKKQQEIMDRIQLAVVQVPKPPASRSLRTLEQKQLQEAQKVHEQIAQFEKNRRRVSPAYYDRTADSVQVLSEEEMSQWNTEFMKRVSQRVEEDVAARTQRERRRHRALQQQLHTHHTHQEMLREEWLVGRLMRRQSQQEKQIAVQLMHIRQQKEVLRQNRIFRERQNQEQRLRDFQQTLHRETALLLQASIEQKDERRKQQELHVQLAAERVHNKYCKHFNICREIVEQTVDLATKAGEYRLLTANLIPGKLMQEWKELWFRALPLYSVSEGEAVGGEPSPEQATELEKLQLLNNQAYEEYMSMTGEWAWPEERECKAPPSNSDILCHVVTRLRNMVNPPESTETPPIFPHFTIRACVLGKPCTGKTSCLSRISEVHGICVLSADRVIQEALEAYHAGEQEQNSYRPENSTESCRSPSQEAEQRQSTNMLCASDSNSAPEESPSAPEPVTDLQPGDLQKKDSKSKLSLRAQHGSAVEKSLRSGRDVPNDLLVDIFIDAIRKVPSGQGWVLDGFPVDISQARLLEKALGSDQANKKRHSRTHDLENRSASTAPRPVCPVLDLVVLLHVSDEQVLDRATQRSHECTAIAEQEKEENTGAADHSSSKENVAPPRAPPGEKSLEQTIIQHRIIGFQNTWPKLEKWFGDKQKILVKIIAEVDEDTLFKNVETVLFNTIMAVGKGNTDAEDSVKASDDDAYLTAPQQTAPESDIKHPHSKSSSSSLKGQLSSPKGHSRQASASSPMSVDAPPPDADWEYVDEPLAKEIPEYLLPYWENTCSSYVSNIKTVMQNLRNERNLIIHHLYNIREDFRQYLQRPDLKQEFVCVWQRDYNSLPDDMRQDEETKAELHQRLNDLKERLWDICDKRKEEAKQERAGVIGDSWLEDHTALLINHYSTLMQIEIDRFQDTMHVLRDYYSGMHRRVLPEAAPDFTCIPMLDILDDNGNQIDRTKRSSSPSERITRSAGKKDLEAEEKKKTKVVPLVPRRPPSTDSIQKGLIFSDEKLLQDIYHTALTAITSMTLAEVQQWGCEEQTEVQQHLERERVHRQSLASATTPSSAKDKKKAGKKKGPPSPTQETSPPPPLVEDAEEVERRAVKSRISREYRSALQHEEGAVKHRLELVQLQALVTVHSLQQQAELAHSTMDEWLGARYLAEINSIDQMAEVVGHHIERGMQITHELLLVGTDFFLDGDTRVVASPPPPLRPPPLERTNDSTLTVLQLHSLCSQLCKIAPTGLLSSTQLCEILQGLIYLNPSSDSLPKAWMQLSDSQIQELVGGFAQDCEIVDWRQFLLCVSQPWPWPSQNQLLKTLKRFKAIDTAGNRVLTLEQYLQVELWFASGSNLPVPDDPTEPLPYDRLAHLREFFFMLFADPVSSPAVCDYMNMLLYFCCHTDAAQGFTRALSLVTQQSLTYTHSRDLLQSVAYMDSAEECDEEEEGGCVDDEGCVSVDALLRVLQHGVTRVTSHHRLHPNIRSAEELQQDLVKVFKELGFKEEEKVPFSMLSQHPFLQDLMESSSQYLLPDIHTVLMAQQNEGETTRFTAA